MPAPQGVLHWPGEELNSTALIEEAELPLPDMSVDRVLLAHALEHTEQLRPLLREIWRVLNPSGRVIAIVPNRRGIWARIDSTPFGHGHPYTAGQLSRLLRSRYLVDVQSFTKVAGVPLRASEMEARMLDLIGA